jgi:hypothetical protein
MSVFDAMTFPPLVQCLTAHAVSTAITQNGWRVARAAGPLQSTVGLLFLVPSDLLDVLPVDAQSAANPDGAYLSVIDHPADGPFRDVEKLGNFFDQVVFFHPCLRIT